MVRYEYLKDLGYAWVLLNPRGIPSHSSCAMGNGWKYLDMAVMGENGWGALKWLELTSSKWLEMAVNGQISRKWLKITENCWKWLALQ